MKIFIAAALLVLTVELPTGQDPTSNSDATWSPTVAGLRGRLLATPYSVEGRRQLALDLEVENIADGLNPISLSWTTPASDSLLELSLEREDGTPIPKRAEAGNEFSTGRYLVQIPRHSAIRISVSKAAYEYQPGRSRRFRPTWFFSWDIPSEVRLYLRGSLRASAIVHLELQRVRIQ